MLGSFRFCTSSVPLAKNMEVLSATVVMSSNNPCCGAMEHDVKSKISETESRI